MAVMAHKPPQLDVEPEVRTQRRLAVRAVKSRITALIAFEAVFIALVTSKNPTFFRHDNFRVILDNMGPQAMVVSATVLLLAAGRFDLSLDGVASLSGVVTGKALTDWGMPVAPAILAGLGVGVAVGAVNGALIEYGGLNPLMTTLAAWWVTAGIALGLTQSFTPSGFPHSFNRLGQARFLGQLMPVWYAVGFVAVLAVILKFTKFGAHAYATGGDREAARLNGVRTRRVGLLLYLLSGGAASLAGVTFAARLSSAPPQAFDGMALVVIAAAVIGGASLAGGRGSVIGGILGLFLLSLFGNAAIYVGISPYWQKAISGTVLAVAVAADAYAEARQRGDGRLRLPRVLRRPAPP
jgi:ribose transport system permease protein